MNDKTKKNSKYTLGITIWISQDGSFELYSNGLKQNVFFLYKLFSASPNCKKVYLVNHGPGEATSIPEGLNISLSDIVRADEVKKKLDYCMIVGAAIDLNALNYFRENGCKIIAYKGGNAAVISMEAVASQSPDKDGERYFDYNKIDAVWMTPQHAHTYKTWCETVYRCPVHVLPQIWDDTFYKMQTNEVKDNFGYKIGDKQWRIGVLDPNITVMKTSHLPAMICEYAYRQKPDLFKAFYITNSIQFADNHHFNSFIHSLQSGKDKKMTVEPRFITWEFLTNHADAVITHHWENGLNYLYYEVLYGNYPLIHNSEFLKGWGYYYQDFNGEDGARALLEAINTHDKCLEEYKNNNDKLFARLNPTSQENIYLHENLLLSVETNKSFN